MPGVPPNAFAKLKQAFKGMLKSKKRQSQQDQPAQKQDEQNNTASKPDLPPKLPPTHPLATGQHSEAQSAAPKPEGSAALDAGSEGAATTQPSQKLGEGKPPVSPAGPSPIPQDDANKSEPVSAVSSEQDKPLPLAKTDGAADEVKAAAPLLPQPSIEEPQPAATENAKPATTTPAPALAAATTADVEPATKTSSESARILDEKMPVMAEEPPEIKTKAAAPGMSATSGPLDDFPMGSDKP